MGEDMADGLVLRAGDAALEQRVLAARGDGVLVAVDRLADEFLGQRTEAAKSDVELAASQTVQRLRRREIIEANLRLRRELAEGVDEISADQRGDELGHRDEEAARTLRRVEGVAAAQRRVELVEQRVDARTELHRAARGLQAVRAADEKRIADFLLRAGA